MVLSLAGGPEGWVNQSPDVVTNAVCAFLLLTRAPPAARGRLKEGGKATHLLANLSKRGSEVQKKVCIFARLSGHMPAFYSTAQHRPF